MQAATHEVRNFEQDVLETSKRRPVLVDFWAPWCGPCRVLGPVLDKLAAEPGAAWSLVKVNTDEHPELGDRYNIRGIPAVKLFVDGAVAAEFTGALPEPAVRQWLADALPTEAKKRLAEAETAIEAGERERAVALLEEALAEEPQNAKARVLLAGQLAFSHPERAADLAEGAAFAGPGFIQLQEAVQTLARLAALDPDALPDGSAADAYREAIEALRHEDFDRALDRFIEVIRTDRYYDEDGARKACIALFHLLGPDHAATQQHRRTFDMALY